MLSPSCFHKCGVVRDPGTRGTATKPTGSRSNTRTPWTEGSCSRREPGAEDEQTRRTRQACEGGTTGEIQISQLQRIAYLAFDGDGGLMGEPATAASHRGAHAGPRIAH
ncbi:hypothetical protein FKP32DRAFT_410374 [Trametes sanguinea]|nr:hypothetical protein FKP32DRAFT_410374 [Trametes sanguinea]